ncbi:MAG: nicotinate-nucleotide adenylyltransferase, partial [Thermosulfidibacteraceae bacterium]
MRSVKGRIGIFGGTFNPVHMGHLIAAEDVRYKMKLDKILFIPSNIPPHKSTKGLISAEDRLNMVKLAIEGNPFFECSDIEIKRGGKSYTIDTVKEVKNINKAEYFFILGGEAFLSFHNWKNPEGILREIDLIVISRPFGAVSSHDLENYLLDLEEILEGFRYVDSEVFG